MKYKMYMALFKPLSWLPLGALYGLSNALSLFMRRVLKYRRKVIRENLSQSYPGLDSKELLAIEKRFYRQLTDNIVETVKLLSISDRRLRRRIEVQGAHLVEEAADRGKPIFLYLGHYANWEWVPAITMFYSRPAISAQIYKALRDEAFDRVMQRVRGHFPSVNIPQDRAMRTMLRLTREHGSFIVGIIDDHSPNHDRSQHITTFLNHPYTLINVGAEEIGRRLDATFLYLDVEKPRRGHYRFTVKEIKPENPAPEYPVTYEYMRLLEQTINRDPGLWLWSHKRWRYKPHQQDIK